MRLCTRLEKRAVAEFNMVFAKTNAWLVLAFCSLAAADTPVVASMREGLFATATGQCKSFTIAGESLDCKAVTYMSVATLLTALLAAQRWCDLKIRNREPPAGRYGEILNQHIDRAEVFMKTLGKDAACKDIVDVARKAFPRIVR
jgi:hypothetical protein